MSTDSPALFFQTELTSWNTSFSPKWLNKCRHPLIESNHYNFFTRKFLSNNLLAKFLSQKSRKYPWKIEISPDGLYLIILKNNNLELRSSKLDFNHINFRCQVYRDMYPQWRCIGWSNFSNYIGVTFSNGMCNIWDIQGSKLVFKYSNSNSIDPVVKIVIINSTKIKIKVIILTMKGRLGIFIIQNLKLLTSHESNVNFITTPILCAEISNNLMIFGTYNQFNGNEAMKNGLFMCRLIEETPFIAAINLSNDNLSSNKSWLSNLFIKKSNDAIYAIQITKDNKKLAALHLSGILSIWTFPSLNFQLQWKPASLINSSLGPNFQKNRILPGNSFDSSIIDICWWNDEYMVVGLQNGLILILNSDLTENGMISLLPYPNIQSSIDKSFFVLNCDTKYTNDNLNLIETSSIVSHQFYLFFKSIFNFISSFRDNSSVSIGDDLELCSLNFQLSQFKLTTPHELFVIHIEKKKYHEALILAKQYDLDLDIVFQRQWRDSEKSIDDIRDILIKIRKRNWILNECLERIPNRVDSLKCLLNLGLKLTESIPDKNDKDFVSLMDSIVIKNIIDSSFFQRQENIIADQDLHKISNGDLDASQIELIRIRAKILNYCDKLLIYEDIINRSRCQFHPARFEEFKNRSPFDLAISFANAGDIIGLEAVLNFYHKLLDPHVLVILSSIPECIQPNLYTHLFDKLSIFNPSENLNFQKPVQIFDWCESQQFADICYGIGMSSLSSNESEMIYYQNHPDQSSFVLDMEHSDSLTFTTTISDWFNLRIRNIESMTLNVEYAWNFVIIARNLNVLIDRNLEFNTRFLFEAVYNVQISNSFLNLSEFQSMTNVEKAKLLTSKTDPDRFILHFIRWIIPFAQEIHCQSPIDSTDFFEQYLTDISTRSLAYIRKIIEDKECINSIMTMIDFKDFVSTYLEIIYQDDSNDTECNLNDCSIICLLLNGLISVKVTDTDQYVSEQKKLQEIENYIVVCRLMEKYGVRKSIKFIHENKSNGDIVENFLTTMLFRYMKNYSKSLTKPIIKSVFQEMQMAISTVFKSIHPKLIYKNLLKSLLESGDKKKITLAAEFMDLTSKLSIISEFDVDDKLLDYLETTDCVTKAARNYIDSSTSTKDKNFQLGKFCLNLVQDTNEVIEAELDFVKCCEFFDKYHNNQSLVPIEVRAVTNRLDLLKICLDNNSNLYRNLEEIVEASSFLCSDKSKNKKFREGEALRLVANKAIICKDWEIVDIVMMSLIHRNHKPCWMECVKVVKNVEYNEIDKKYEFGRYAVTNCVLSALQDTMKLVKDLEIASLSLCGNCSNQPVETSTTVNRNLIKQPIKFISSGLTDISSKLSIKSLIDKSSDTLMKLSNQMVQLGSIHGEVGRELYSKGSIVENVDKMCFSSFYQSNGSLGPLDPKHKNSESQTTLVKILTLSSLLPPISQENEKEIDSIHLKLLKFNLNQDTFLSIIHSLFINDSSLIYNLRHEMKPNLFNRALILFMIEFNLILRYSNCGIPWKTADSLPKRSIQTMLNEIKRDKLSSNQLSILESMEKEFYEYFVLDKVSKILPNICLMKFFSSVDYRQEIVFKLSQVVDADESFSYSLILCNRFGINPRIVAWNYFQSFVKNICKLNKSEFDTRFSRFQTIFQWNLLLDDPIRFRKDLESTILKSPENDYFNTVLRIIEQVDINFILFDRSIERLLQWLHVFEIIFKDISTCSSYVDFIIGSFNHHKSIIESVKQVINTENLELCSKLMTEFNLSEEFINIKKDFSVVLANQALWSNRESLNTECESSDFKHRFLKSLKNFSTTDFENFKDFIYSILFEKSIDYIDLLTKIDALKTATKYIDDLCNSNSTMDEDFSHNWIGVNMEIEIWLSHFENSVKKVVDQLKMLASVNTAKTDILKIAECLPPENYWNNLMKEMLLSSVSYQDFFTFTWELNIELTFVEEAIVSHICHIAFSKFIPNEQIIEKLSNIFEDLDEFVDSSSIENIISSILTITELDIPISVIHWIMNEFVYRLRSNKSIMTHNIDFRKHIFSIIENWKISINKKLEITNTNNLFIIDSLVQECDSPDQMLIIGKIIELIELIHEDDHLWQYWVKSCVIKGPTYASITFDQFQNLKNNKLYNNRFSKLIKDAVHSLVAFNPQDAISLLILKDPVESLDEVQNILTNLKSNPTDYSNTMKNIHGKSLEIIINQKLVPLYAKTILFQRLVNFITKESDDPDMVQDILEQLRQNGLHDEAKWLASSSSHINPALKTIEIVSGFWKRFSTSGSSSYMNQN